MQPTPQKQTARNLVLSPSSQAAYGGTLADNLLTFRASADPSSVFSNPDKRYTDQGAIGHGTDFATVSLRTAFNTMGNVKGMGGIDIWALGWMMSLIFGQEAVTGSASPYTHTYSIPNITALMPCTTVYVEDTDDVHRKYPDMAAKSLTIDMPERGPITASMDLVGTGRFVPGTMTTLPAIVAPNMILGSDMNLTLTPAGGALSLGGRVSGLSFKLDRGSAPFEANGDGLSAGSVNAGALQYSIDGTILANQTDDINTLYENDTPMVATLSTNPAKAYQLSISMPVAKLKGNKLGNKDNLVAWSVSFDQSTAVQVGANAALSAFLINTCPAYLIPA